jgi:hypothetical protein
VRNMSTGRLRRGFLAEVNPERLLLPRLSARLFPMCVRSNQRKCPPLSVMDWNESAEIQN